MLVILGEWYGLRKRLFMQSVPARCRRREPPGVAVSPAGFRAIACEHGGDLLLHLVNMRGSSGPVEVELEGGMWKGPRSASLEPQGTGVEINRGPGPMGLGMPSELVDRIDAVVRLRR
ncbi:MAG: hypothetical protein QME88_02270 [Actinomycetota bacterium]|nr:hypothetical protein [Actinomycetota bacterium]